ncbi:MAG: (d)CMP kinase [Smithellaceae bacterium]|nr:(d)CMP kinase [Smithellaceae bacterium]
MGKGIVATIDGPAGAGKSTVARMLAKRLSLLYLDTGALYRAVAFLAIEDGLSLDDETALGSLCEKIKIEILTDDLTTRVIVDGADISAKIRTEEVSLAASKVSAYSMVRKALLHFQRAIGERGGIVAEGRDMGTVVFPDADFKFFLDADMSERAKRRYHELCDRAETVDLAGLEKDIMCRDRQDREREIAPLKPAPEAIIIDSTDIPAQLVVEKMVRAIATRR